MKGVEDGVEAGFGAEVGVEKQGALEEMIGALELVEPGGVVPGIRIADAPGDEGADVGLIESGGEVAGVDFGDTS